MGIKSTKVGLITNEYPRLMQNHLGTVILFTEKGKGTVLDAGENPALDVGYHASSWDMKPYRDLHGAIKLENE